MKRYIVTAVILALVIMTTTCTRSISGTSEVGNPQKVSGVIVDSLDRGVANIPVVLVNVDYVPMPLATLSKNSFTPASYYQGVSDSGGHFCIDVDQKGSFNLVAADTVGKRAVFLDAVKVNSENILLEPVVLKKTETFTIYTENVQNNNFLAVKGSLFSARIDPGKPVVMSLPGNCPVPVVYDGVGLSVDSKTTMIPIPEFSASDSILVKNDTLKLTIVKPGTDSTLYEYRFRFDDTVFSAWSNNATSTWSYSSVGVYRVQIQSRLIAQPDYQSEFSDDKTVTVVEKHLITAPVITGPDTVEIGKAYSYRAIGAKSNLGDPVEYQWKRDESIDNQWIADSTVVHTWTTPGTHIIKAKARSIRNKSFESAWPDYHYVVAK